MGLHHSDFSSGRRGRVACEMLGRDRQDCRLISAVASTDRRWPGTAISKDAAHEAAALRRRGNWAVPQFNFLLSADGLRTKQS